MSWFNRILPSIGRKSQPIQQQEKNSIPQGLWKLCPECDRTLYVPELEQNLKVCSMCSHHFALNARERVDLVLDKDKKREEIAEDVEAVDWLKFRDTKTYKARLTGAIRGTGEREALVCIRGSMSGIPLVVVSFEFGFLGGSMSSAVGEKFVRATDYCAEHGLPLLAFSTSGGARMQESMFSLLQMARTSAALEWLRSRKLPYISVLVDPVYGGVSASLAMLGDIIIAEPAARVGFTGPRVIEQTLRVKLPSGFQRSEFLLEHGMIDMIVHRSEMKAKLASLLGKMLDSGA